MKRALAIGEKQLASESDWRDLVRQLNKRDVLELTVLLVLTVTWALASPIRASPQTTSIDIELLNFSGVQVATSGILVGNMTATFSFVPNSLFQQISSTKATIVYQRAPATLGCSPCSRPGDTLNIQIGQGPTATIFLKNSTSPIAVATTLGGVRTGSNFVNIFVSNPTGGTSGIYYVYEVRISVEYTFG